MSNSSLKKVSAAAVAAVLALAGASHAAPITVPYITNFSDTAPDSTGYTFHDGTIITQEPGVVTGTTGYVYENGETNDAAVINPGGGLTITTPAAATPGSFTDVYQSNLADHSLSGPTDVSNGNGVALATAGGQFVVNYTMTINNVGSLASNNASGTEPPASGFGARVLDGTDNLLASLFTAPPAYGTGAQQPTSGEEDVYVQTGTTGGPINTDLIGPAAGTSATYSIALDFKNDDFTVYVNGVTSPAGTDIPFGTGTNPTTIGGFALSSDNNGAENSATFSAFSVLPEPTSFAMIGLGGLLLLGKRRARRPA